ncbi:MAG: hypothetical protein H6970_01255 [Gammaproteobacteria bacterium]|nr:hypothetical protein [Gammaproteobacteria bacterium]MCP5423685.1 hypothetical protein [Gammaproteobacteria bacterium]
MSAVDTALRVLDWALTGFGPPPIGDLRDAEQLKKPSGLLRHLLGAFAASNAARLGLRDLPPTQDHQVTLSGAILAAALGALHTPALARRLLAAVSPAPNPWDWITHHGLLARSLPFVADADADLLDDFLSVSPLTAVVHHPAQGRRGEAFACAHDWLNQSADRNWLQRTLARPSQHPTVLHWRQELLERLRLTGEAEQTFVLNVYETAMIHHRPEYLEQIRHARDVLTTTQVKEETLRIALRVAAWWGPLTALEHSHPHELRARRQLGYAYREGISLHRLAQRLSWNLS